MINPGCGIGRRTLIASLAAGASLSAMGLALPAAAQQRDKPPADALYRNAKAPIAARVDDLLKRMTLDEKVAQMIGVWQEKNKIQTQEGDFSAEKARTAFPHGVGQISRPSDRVGVEAKAANIAGASGQLPNRSPRETADYINAAQKWAVEETRLGIPVLMHEEALHGYAAREATSFPQSIALASTFDPALVTRVFSAVAGEVRARGAHLVLAPVVDVARDPRWGRIEETYGEDPHLVAEMGLAAIRGFQGETLPLAKDKVLVTLKHMTGHGQPENGVNVGPAQISERTLRENFFPPFERAVKELPVLAVMASYNEIDGVPSHANPWLLRKVLREDWGFKGAVVSDYFAIRELQTRHRMFATPKESALRALEATVDIELPDGAAYPLLPQLIASGRVHVRAIDAAVRRLLTMKFEAGLFDNPYVDADAADGLTGKAETVALAHEAAQKAIILLKNENAVLPLATERLRRVALLGTHAQDTPIGGYSDTPRHVVSVLEGLKSSAAERFTVDYAEGVRITKSRSWTADAVELVESEVNRPLIAEAVRTARRADVVVMVLGENEQLSREAWADNHLGDAASLDLVGQQMDLARAVFALGKPTIVVLLNGRPLAIGELVEKADAVLECWYLGQETGRAVADVLLGVVNPGGKLPVSMPRSVGQLPIFYNHKPTARRGYLFAETSPLFPFGFGLSYTSFDIAPPRLLTPTVRAGESVRLEVDVANTGGRAGDEVVQIYVRDDHASVTRPVLELKAFQRVSLKPDERRTIAFTLPAEAFALWDMAMKRVVEPGTFTIGAGPHSGSLKTATLTVVA